MSESATLTAVGIGLGRSNKAGELLDVWFPAPRVDLSGKLAEAFLALLISDGVAEAAAVNAVAAKARQSGDADLADSLQSLAALDKPLVAVRLTEDSAITSTAEAYLKLHLLSHRLRKPNEQNLDGIFAHLPNVAWTNEGPVDPAELNERIVDARARGDSLTVRAIDKFPCMTDYVAPAGVRIADATRVRLGAYCGDGTTVMHEGFINFNAGALGPNMIEGRISQGVVVGANSDLGGGCSTMGTLSGGNDVRVSIGENCLIGANGGSGIPLGDRCTIEAGLYITGSTPVLLRDDTGEELRRVKAREMAGVSDLLFIRNGATGQVECRANRSAISLNDALHSHN